MGGTGAVVLCPYLGEVHKDIFLWGKRCPMPPGPLLALLVDSLLSLHKKEGDAIAACCHEGLQLFNNTRNLLLSN